MFKKESKKKSAVSTKNNEDQPRFYSLKRNSKSFNPRYFALKIINKNMLKTRKDVEHTMSERYIL